VQGFRLFGNKPFMRFARKFGVTDRALWNCVQALPDANLGGGVYKFRIARAGEGSSGGARSIVAMKHGERAVMMFGFEKKDLQNVSVKELSAFKKLAKIYLDRSEDEMDLLVAREELVEIRRS